VNILIINDWAHVNGGASKVALSSADALARRGHQVTVFTAVPPPSGTPSSGYRVVATGQPELVSDPNAAAAAARGLWNVVAHRTLRDLLNGLDRANTVVHYHAWMKALSPSVLYQGLRSGHPTVTTLHDYFSACPNGGFYNYQSHHICTLKPLSASCMATHCDSRGYAHKLWRVGRQLLQRDLAGFPARARHFITLGSFSERILAPYLPPSAVLHRVRNPIDVPRLTPAEVERNTGVAFVGRLSPEKGAELLGRSAAAAGVPVTFIGDGPSRAAIEGACPTARMAGWLSREPLWAELRRHRALVLPSLWYEGQPLVVGEAAALGLPAIVPDRCAASDAIEDGVTGLLFRMGDADDLREKLVELSRNTQLAAGMGKAAFERYWSDPPTLESHIDDLEAVYRRVLRDHKESATAAKVPLASSQSRHGS
jgi:glycosyltransferase involved in cell wall biosynthesis